MTWFLLALALGATSPEERLYAEAFDALEMWDLAAAESALQRLAQAGAPEEALADLRGRVLFFRGDYAAAAKQVPKETDPSYALLAEATRDETATYEVHESPHFTLRSPPGKDALLALYALDTLEAARTRIGEDLGELPGEKIRVEILRDPTALSRLSPLTQEQIKASGTIALCKYNKLMIVSPRAMYTGYTWQDTLAHELTHYLITRKSKNKTPIWIHEGIAKYEESRWRSSAGEALSPVTAALLSRRLQANTLISFERMHPSIALLKTQEDAALAFAEVFTIIEFLLKERGASLERLLKLLAAGQSDTAAVASVGGEPFDRLTRDWKAYLRKRPMPKEFLPLTPTKLKFRDPADKAAAPMDDLDAEIEDVNAHSWAHLGSLLLQRSRTPAALTELAKADQRIGARSPALSNLYARALLGTGRFADAERVLRASLVPYPDIAQTHLHLAEVHFAAQQWKAAEAELEAANAIDPFDPVIHQGLLRVAKEAQDPAGQSREKEALTILDKGD